jgi:threonylcarbamoyladenosine tRNA methylthiotransferase MtaB
VKDLVEEAKRLAETHPEIVITGIHIGTYGRDIGECLSGLIAELVNAVPVVRFRLSSIEATEVDDLLADLLTCDSARVAPHLHAPLQSGSNRVLRRMGRHWYTAEEYEDAVRRIVSACDTFALSADVITGFPGEDEADHAATLALVERLPFTSLHVFPYSPRPGTAALKLGQTVPSAVARRRSKDLRRLADQKASAHRQSRIGDACDIVVTERGRGLTEDYLSVGVSETIARRTRFNGILSDHSGRLTASAL